MRNSIYPKFNFITFFVLSLGISPTFGQEIRYELIDTGVLTHSTHGKGIEMRIKPSALPEGGLSGEVIESILPELCRHYAPTVIPFVIERTEISDPSFIAVRIISGNSVADRYVLQAYEIADGTCGDEL